MGREMTFKVEKPYTEQELKEFKQFRLEVKALLKKGKLKVVEKFSVFAFILSECTEEEITSVNALLKKEHGTLAFAV